jgi:hypothetical protein
MVGWISRRLKGISVHPAKTATLLDPHNSLMIANMILDYGSHAKSVWRMIAAKGKLL